jgi:hypothetical protein
MSAFAPLYALHKDADGKVLDAGSFNYSYKLTDWLKTLDVRPGDKVEFDAVAVRADEVEAPALSVVAA